MYDSDIAHFKKNPNSINYERVLGPSKKNFFFQFLEIVSQFLEIVISIS